MHTTEHHLCNDLSALQRALRTPMGRTPLQLPAAQPPTPPAVPIGQFELYEGSRARAREGLQAFLVRVIDRCQQGFGVADTLGFLPRTSIANKLKYYK